MSQYHNRVRMPFVLVLSVLIIVLVIIVVGRVEARRSVLVQTDQGSFAYLPFTTISFPGTPALLSPQSDAVLETLIPTFEWNMGFHPTGTRVNSRLAIGPDPDPDTDFMWAQGFGSNGTQHILAWANLEPNTLYYWRVGAIYDGNHDNIYWSETRQFTTAPSGGVILDPPTPTLPTNGSTIPLDNVVLEWSAVPGALEYSVTVREYDVDNFGYSWSGLTQTQKDISGHSFLDPGKRYKWHVVARNNYAWSPESEKWDFSISSTANKGTVSMSPNHFLVQAVNGKMWINQED